MDHRTEQVQQLFKAKIKIKGNITGFIPSEIDMGIGDERFTIKLRAISKLKVEHRNSGKLQPEQDNFNRCIINLAGEAEEFDDGKRKKDDGGTHGSKSG